MAFLSSVRVLRSAFFFALCACGTRSSLAIGESPSIDAAPTCSPFVVLPDPPPLTPSHATCLTNTTDFDAKWELRDPAWCLVSHYDVPSKLGVLTWGRHGGPLEGPSAVTPMRRWSPPNAPTGTLTATSITIDAELSSGMTWTGPATDLPFRDWTALIVAPSVGDKEMWFVRDGHVDARSTANVFAGPVGLAEGGGTRLLFLDDSKSRKDGLALIEAIDGCGAGGCGGPTSIDGPHFNGGSIGIFGDSSGNVFGAYSIGLGRMGGEINLQGYARGKIAPGACPTTSLDTHLHGVAVFGVDGELVYGWDEVNSGMFGVGYHTDESGALVFGRESFDLRSRTIEPWSERWGNLQVLIDDQRRLWLLDANEKTPSFWVLARK